MNKVFQSKRLTFCVFSAKKLGSSSSSSSGRFANATLVRLSEFLSSGYKKGVRPVKDWRTSTIVAIDLMVYSILNVVSWNSCMSLISAGGCTLALHICIFDVIL